MPRKYSGPLQPGRKSAYVPGMRRNYRKKPAPMTNRIALARMIKRVSLRQCETKIASQKTDANGIDLFHNKTHYVKNLLNTIQGVTANPGTDELANRIGNEVIAQGLKIRFQVISAPEHPNFNFKYFVFRYETNVALDDSVFWCGPAGLGGNANRMLDFADTRNVTILKSGLVQNRNKLPTDTTFQPVNNVYRDIWIPLNNKKIKYNGNDSPDPKYTTIGMCIVPFDANNTLETDRIAFWNYTTRFYYKDP